MPPRATWKGFLNLSLVSVAVKAYSATTESSKVHLNQLHGECNSRIRYDKTCPIHGSVSNAEIVKGYEYAKDQYVIIDLDELDKLRTQEDVRSIRIETFVAPGAIDPLYLTSSSYFLIPDGAAGQKPYALILQAMIDRNVYCVAQVVLSKREHVVLIRPMDGLLCMTALRYASEVKSASTYKDEVADMKVGDQELALARMLIDETSSEEFDLSVYKDKYNEKLTQLIEIKVNGEELVAAPTVEPKQVINLMDALRASVSAAQGGDQGSGKQAKAPPPSAAEDELVKQLSGAGGGKKKKPSKKKTG